MEATMALWVWLVWNFFTVLRSLPNVAKGIFGWGDAGRPTHSNSGCATFNAAACGLR